jgi:FixJ family two-component response regulator
MNPATPTVFVVDDDVSFSRGLGRLLRASGYQVEAYASPLEFTGSWRPDQHGCLLLDIRLPGVTGLDVQRWVAGSSCPIPIVFMTGHADIESCVQAMKAGATDFLLKPFQDEELLSAIERAFAKDLAERRRREELRGMRDRLARLTTRELQVFSLVTKGLLNKQIGALLGAKEGTVKMHRGHVMLKLQVRSVAELVSFANHLGLDDPRSAPHAIAPYRPLVGAGRAAAGTGRRG